MITGGVISLIGLPVAYMLFKAGFPPYTILIIYISTAGINVAVGQVLLKIIINFNISFFVKTAYLKILYVSILIAPLFLFRDIFPTGFSRFIFFSLFAVCWLLVAIYFAGLEKQEREMLSQIVKKLLKSNIKSNNLGKEWK